MWVHAHAFNDQRLDYYCSIHLLWADSLAGGLTLNWGASGCPYRSELDEITFQQSSRSCYSRDHAEGNEMVHAEHGALLIRTCSSVDYSRGRAYKSGNSSLLNYLISTEDGGVINIQMDV